MGQEMRPTFTDIHMAECIRRYQAGEWISVIASDIGFCYSTVHKRLLRAGIPIRGEAHLAAKKYDFRTDIFDQIDTEEKAYWLGFLYADGCNYETTYSVSLGLAKEDGNHVFRFCEFIGTNKRPSEKTHKPRIISNPDKLCRIQNTISISCRNRHFSQRLAALGMVKAKTHKLKFPTVEQVPADLVRHFIRGYFDGDGHFSSSLKKAHGITEFVMGFTGTDSFVRSIQDVVRRVTGRMGYISTRYPENQNNIRTLTLSGNRSVERFADWLYANAGVFMSRKERKYQELKTLNNMGGIHVIQYDKNASIVKVYDSINFFDSHETFTSKGVRQCCSLNRCRDIEWATYKGYVWRYDHE